MKKLISMIAAVSIGAGVLAAPALAAQEREPVRSIQELLDRVRADSRDAAAENQRRLQEFRQRRDEQSALLRQAQGTLSALQAQAEQGRVQFEANSVAIAELDAELRAAQGEYGELFGAARQAAGEVAALIEGSLVSSQYPRRHDPLTELAESRTLPDRRELDQIWQAQLSEMRAQGEVVTYNARVVGQNDGQPLPVTRVGPFIAMVDRGGAKFVQWQAEPTSRTAGYTA